MLNDNVDQPPANHGKREKRQSLVLEYGAKTPHDQAPNNNSDTNNA